MGIDPQLDKLVGFFAELPQVEAVTLGGSRTSGWADGASDVDVYVHAKSVIPLEVRRQVVERLGGASVANLGGDYFGDGDEWLDAATGARFDVIYFGLGFLREQLERPLKHFRASLGYSTAFAYTVNRASILYDPEGSFRELQVATEAPYPDPLREAVVRYNHPMLRGTISSYWEQLEKAVVRNDVVSLNHRLAALLASYFDIVFATNRLLHPGEKRLLATALSTCGTLPDGFEADLTAALRSAGDGAALLETVGRSLEALDVWLGREGLLG